ncbi:MAG: hypothetical protein H6662_03945 [Ardenticatenaceae bacterium]|nr:hypothetical protein [Anaerolineales bacterium]MCB8920716.1 hypothetical protein [Ardenticatenaceae bacterium]MCB8989675.1 hypothetical protein [Ardenticatenaceae bacterium]MCB9002866.1 hypothetical protein [Ardenticatenaceae bacterium]
MKKPIFTNTHGRKRPFLHTLLALTLLTLVPLIWLTVRAQVSNQAYLPVIYSPPLPTPQVSDSPAYGVNFISAPERIANEEQFQNGVSTGAAWNRWPMYWFNVERSAGLFCWNPTISGCDGAPDTDTAVIQDINHGLKSNAILLGTPGFYITGLASHASNETIRRNGFEIQTINTATPQGLYASVFTDGSDTPGAGKQINPENKWAMYVFTAVSRYKPGGVLAQQQGWSSGVGITHWEMWNEPDLTIFWDSSLADFARLQKVGYLAAKQADANAQVLFGALANNSSLPNYYGDVLTIYDDDPLAATHGYFHDILATHSYFTAWQSWYHVFRATNTMGAHGLSKPIWLNESGVPAWNDYPGPVWDAHSSLRATMDEQASYIIQSAMYATFAGADAIFHFQLYDGCGNQPAFTDFPPHNGELCDANGMLITDSTKPCAGDANGLFRNPSNDPSFSCFTQHPQAGTARPNFAAYRVLTTYLTNVTPYLRQRLGAPKCVGPFNGQMVEPIEVIGFEQPGTGKRVVGLWTLCGDNETAVLTATNPAGTATLVYPDGSTQAISAQNGSYTIQLPGATNRNPYPGAEYPAPFYPIGGRPVILVESMSN